MFKSKFLKSILIILAVLIIGSVGYALGRTNMDIGNKKATKTRDLEQEVKEVVSKVVRENSVYSHKDFADPLPEQEPWYASEQKLID